MKIRVLFGPEYGCLFQDLTPPSGHFYAEEGQPLNRQRGLCLRLLAQLLTQVAAVEKRSPWQIVRTSFRFFKIAEVPGFNVSFD